MKKKEEKKKFCYIKPITAQDAQSTKVSAYKQTVRVCLCIIESIQVTCGIRTYTPSFIKIYI